ncbi:MAG: YdjY domain-containing protein [Acidobacteriota bacterium]
MSWRGAGGRLCAVVLLAVVPITLNCSARPAATVTVVSKQEIRFDAVAQAGRFTRGAMPGYHALVFREGASAGSALLVADVTDEQVLDALTALGAVPGDALGLDTWDDRNNRASQAPDRTIEGPAIEVLIRIPGRGPPVPLATLLTDSGRRGLDLRFGGHRANIPAWRSGCIVCLFSCPGSKIGNAAYTIRDYVDGTARFGVRPGVLPEDGGRVEVVVRFPGPEG